MLTRILGSTVYATSTVLATFMAGLVLGSFLAGRVIDRARPEFPLWRSLDEKSEYQFVVAANPIGLRKNMTDE